MVIYEVNLTIDKSVYDQYLTWLKSHVAGILNFDGFRRAQINEEIKIENENTRLIVVRFAIDSWPYLEDYLQNHASEMRKEAIDQFGSQFNAERRIFNIIDTLNINKQSEVNII